MNVSEETRDILNTPAKCFSLAGLTESGKLVDVSFKDSTHAMYYSYIARVSCDKDSVTLQEGETTDYKWVDAAGFISYVDSDGAMKSHNQRYEKYISTLR